MRNKILFFLAVTGLIAALIGAYISGIKKKAVPPAFAPSSNPYGKGIYANGIIESYQGNGENVNVYPEIGGTVTRILAVEGQTVPKGAPLITIDDSVQKALVEQQQAQAQAALAALEALRAQPRKENLDIASAQVDFATASLKSSQDQYQKQLRSYQLDPRSVSKDVLDTAENAVKVARANLEVVERQYALTRAGAWSYDLKNQERQYQALIKAYEASRALLDHYTIKAPVDGMVLAVKAAVGSYVSPQGVYSTYTGGFAPVLVLGSAAPWMEVRCYVDEILVHRLPPPERMEARMSIRGTSLSIPLEYERMQPYVMPKIELSDQRTERVDLRVLPIIFKFQRPEKVSLYPGLLEDVYIGEKQ